MGELGDKFDLSFSQVLMISVYTAFKYRNSLVVFSPVYDEMIDFKPLEPRTSHKQEFDLAQAMMLRQRSPLSPLRSASTRKATDGFASTTC
jgi:hypothetical protein